MAGIPHQIAKPWPPCLHAGDPVRVLGDDLIAALGRHLPQVEKLGLRMLIDRADSHVQGGPLHLRRPFGFGTFFVTYDLMNSSSTSVMFSP